MPIHPSVYPIDHAGAKTQTILHAADYGVKGDGKTDDGPAISKAVNDAIQKQATLKFDEGKTYRILSTSNAAARFTSPFAFQEAEGVTIDGGRSLFLFKPGINYLAINQSGNIKICNMRFDLVESIYLVGKVKSVSGSKVTFETDIEPSKASFDYSDRVAFSIMYYEGTQHRPHQFINTMKKTGEKEVAVTYRSASHGYRQGDTVFLPNPGIGHCFSETVYVNSCYEAMTLQNIQIHAAPAFVSSYKNNDAEIYFDNIDLVPSPDQSREIQMVSWRDGFHCKDNRRPFHWSNCENGNLFDDVFNISSTLGIVTKVENMAKISVCNYEFKQNGITVPFNCRAGDVIDVYDPKTNTFCGTATVREAETNPDQSVMLTLDYGEKLSGVKEGFVVGNRETCAPGSTIKDCSFTGTFRLLRNIRVEKTTFNQLCTWIKVEGGVEGPLPGDIDFIECTFNGGTMDIGTDQGAIASKIKSIGFYGCTENGMTRAIASGCQVDFKKNWSEETLYTTLARKMTVIPTELRPTTLDLKNGVTYDWLKTTMAVEGGTFIRQHAMNDEAAKKEIASSTGFEDRILTLTGSTNQTRFSLAGLDAALLPSFHRKGALHFITIDYYTSAPCGKIAVTTDSSDKVILDSAFSEKGLASRASFLYEGGKEQKGLVIDIPEGQTVYIGKISVSAASVANPTDSQMEDGYVFPWSTTASGVTIGKDNDVLKVEDITDAKAKKAIQNAKSGFTGGKVLHVKGALGDFTGLTDASYYTPGVTYHLSIDAYIASPMKPKNGTTVYLLAMDDTAGNRVIAKGLFEGEGLYHFEADWTVGKNNERALSFYISNVPAAYADMYIGDFVITKSAPQNPASFDKRTDIHMLTSAEMKKGYTFDFTKDNVADLGMDGYTSIDKVPRKTREILTENGFGDTVYFANCSFSFHSIPENLIGGGRTKISMLVYDVKGNLSADSRGAFVMLHMTDGKQNSAEVRYTLERDSEHDRIYTLTFTSTPPQGTDALLFYSIAPFEFYIGSITVSR